MKFVALVSGGKDSIFSIMESQRQGHELVACVHLGKPASPKPSSSSNSDQQDEEEEESYMYQTAGSEVVQVIVKECLQVPLILHVRTGASVNTSLVYQHQQDGDNGNADTAATETTTAVVDEVEDLYQALLRAKQEFPEIQAVSSGAILSTYQRVRIENVCQRLGLVSLSFLWRRASQRDVLHEMIHDAHIHAVLVRTAAPPGLVPRKHLNQSIRDLESQFQTLYTKYQFHVCGEGGEYETLCLDCPIYKKRLVLDNVKVHEPDHDGVGVLQILACHAEDKNDSSSTNTNGDSNSNAPSIRVDETSTTVASKSSPLEAQEEDDTLASSSSSPVAIPQLFFYPHVRRIRAGLWHVSDIVSPTVYHASTGDDEGQESALAVQEALQVFRILDTLLRRHSCTPQDVVYVHLYLSQMSHFAAINPHFQEFFGVLLPPSRSCVAIPTTSSGRRVQMDCLVQCGSGEYMRQRAASSPLSSSKHVNPYTRAALNTTSAVYRNVLHVQSRSHWAPVCVGPYSQANTLYSAVHVLAGQIGLEPATMTLRPTWGEQLQQVWTNIASVLDALDNSNSVDGSPSSLSNNLLSGLVYIADKVHRVNPAACLATIHETSYDQVQCNGGIVPGAVDNMMLPTAAASSSFGGYEDEETMLELISEQEKEDYLKSTASSRSDSRNNSSKSICPLLVVSIPEMPVGALVEVEVVAATSKATSCLSMDDYSVALDIDEATARRGIVCNNMSQKWDTGHDFDDQQHNVDVDVSSSSSCRIDSWVRSLGKGCTAYCLVTATTPPSSSTGTFNSVDAALVIHNMATSLSRSLHEGPSCLGLTSLLHIRFYYVLNAADDGQGYPGVDISAEIRSSLQQALSIATTAGGENTTTPAISVVPVYSMSLLDMPSSSSSSKDETNVRDGIFMAMQAILIEPTALETELWIRHGR